MYHPARDCSSGDPAGRRRSRAVATGIAVLTVILLAGCTSSDGTGKSASSSSSTGSSSTGGQPSAGTSQPALAAAITTSVSAHRKISPSQPVVVSIANGKLTSVVMTNPAGKQVTGAITPDGTSWRNTEALGYSRTYRVTATGANADGATVTKRESVTTLTPGNMTMPYIEDIYGTQLTGAQKYGVGMVVRVQFDEQVNRKDAERALKVTTTPSVVGGWYWSDDSNVYWRPKVYYPSGTKVTVAANVYGKRVGHGLYGQADKQVSFTIGPKHVSIANAKTHHVRVYFDNKFQRSMPTSMGQGGVVQGKNGPIYLWTMPGVYTVINHENPAIMSSDSYGLPKNSPLGYAPEKVYWSTKISVDGIYLHELDTTVPEQGHSNVSHGCLNLNLKNAKWFYQHSVIGDVVRVVHSGGPKIRFDQGGQWSIPWADWLKGSALQ